MQSKNQLPNFIGIGAQRSATTWFYECLKEHPDIFIPNKKELHFFNKNYHQGLEWYCRHFQKSKGYKAVGEITPNYLNHDQAIPRMASVVPDARLFVIFRDPVDRAFSAYIWLRHQNQYKKMTFKEACQHSDYYLLRLSLYADDLQRAFKYYNKEHIKIFLYDDVIKNKHQVIKDLYSFLEIDDTFIPESINQIYNAVLFPKIQYILNILKISKLININQSSSLGQIKRKISFNIQKKQHEKINNLTEKYLLNTQDEEYKKKLREYFREDILELERLINHDLSKWL